MIARAGSIDGSLRRQSRHQVWIRLAMFAIAGSAFLSGCGFRGFETREAWRAEAEGACMRAGLLRENAHLRRAKPIDGPGPCGTDQPLRVGAFENNFEAGASPVPLPMNAAFDPKNLDLPLTFLKPEAVMGCPMTAWTEDWVAGSVQPAAFAWFGQGVAELRIGGAYACRRRNHNPRAKLSEHAFGNAIDVMGFVLADGTLIRVASGWRGDPAEQGFLRDVLSGACTRFKTVLGPGSDALHADHFHLDLARHDARGTKRYCKPRIEAIARPEPGRLFAAKPSEPDPKGANDAPRAFFGAPSEVEGGFDPRAFDITGSLPDLPPSRKRRGDPGTVTSQEADPLPERRPGLLPDRK